MTPSFRSFARRVAMRLASIPACALAELQVMGDASRKNPQVADSRVVQRRHEPVQVLGIAAHHALLERQPSSCPGIESVRVDEGVGHVLGRMAGGAGIDRVASGPPREAPAVSMSEVEEVVAVLGGADEVAVFAEAV